jgi:ABC-type Mn2+/Zn2+ transport system permease subunit
MQKQRHTGVIRRFLRTAILIDASLSLIVGLISFAVGWRNPEAYGTTLVRTGMLVILVACLIAAGGLSSRVQDATAFSLSGAGNMAENLRQISEARQSSLGCVFLLVISGIGLVMIGYLLQIIAELVGQIVSSTS